MIGSKGMGITARANNGYWSAAQLAKEYGTPYNRVQQLLEAGVIPAFRHPHRMTWQIDPADLNPSIMAELRKEKPHPQDDTLRPGRLPPALRPAPRRCHTGGARMTPRVAPYACAAPGAVV